MILFKTDTLEQIRPPSSDERIAAWAARYFAQGHHRRPSKPRLRAASPTTHALPPERAPADVDPSI